MKITPATISNDLGVSVTNGIAFGLHENGDGTCASALGCQGDTLVLV